MWTKEYDAAITICDKDGIILQMNEKACKVFENYGGKDLIGKNLFDCHSSSSQIKLKEMIEKEESNTYTIEKNGIKKLIHQSPWYKDGICKGLVELSIEIPSEMPHFVRK